MKLLLSPLHRLPLADRLDSFLGLGEEPEDKDTVLDVDGKPVFNGTEKVGQDAGEMDPLPDPLRKIIRRLRRNQRWWQ